MYRRENNLLFKESWAILSILKYWNMFLFEEFSQQGQDIKNIGPDLEQNRLNRTFVCVPDG